MFNKFEVVNKFLPNELRGLHGGAENMSQESKHRALRR